MISSHIEFNSDDEILLMIDFLSTFNSKASVLDLHSFNAEVFGEVIGSLQNFCNQATLALALINLPSNQ